VTAQRSRSVNVAVIEPYLLVPATLRQALSREIRLKANTQPLRGRAGSFALAMLRSMVGNYAEEVSGRLLVTTGAVPGGAQAGDVMT
jgi:hypothetical protein